MVPNGIAILSSNFRMSFATFCSLESFISRVYSLKAVQKSLTKLKLLQMRVLKRASTVTLVVLKSSERRVFIGSKFYYKVVKSKRCESWWFYVVLMNYSNV